jgi:hypothetical protein
VVPFVVHKKMKIHVKKLKVHNYYEVCSSYRVGVLLARKVENCGLASGGHDVSKMWLCLLLGSRSFFCTFILWP